MPRTPKAPTTVAPPATNEPNVAASEEPKTTTPDSSQDTAPEAATPPQTEMKTDDGSFDTAPPNHDNLSDGVGNLTPPQVEGVSSSAPTPATPPIPQAQHAPRKGGKYYEIRADDASRLKEKDEAVRAGKRVEKIGSGYGAVFRIYA